MTDPDGILRSVEAFRDLLNSLCSAGVSQAVELTQLDRLVRTYPDAARKALELADRDRGRAGRQEREVWY